jgi:hypothetical protein
MSLVFDDFSNGLRIFSPTVFDDFAKLSLLQLQFPPKRSGTLSLDISANQRGAR